jgi:hypothetical protein
MFVIWNRIIFLGFILLTPTVYVVGQQANEVLLSPIENAYNPVPNLDGSVIAYIRTGWGRPGGSGGFGRSNLRSEVMLMNTDGLLLVKEPIADAFLAGWTSDGKNLVCYRDLFYYLVSPSGVILKRINQPKGFPPETDRPERVSYLSDIDSFIWVKSSMEGSSIEAVGRTIAKVSARLGAVMVPSPNERFLAVTSGYGLDLWIYDRQNKSWANLGAVVISPGDWNDSTSWNPWFADSSRLVFTTPSGIVISSPDGKEKEVVAKPNLKSGLATPSPDGQFIAYVTFEPRPMKDRPDLKFFGGTIIWIVSTSGHRKAQRITESNQDTTFSLRWLNNRQLIFDRIADERFYAKTRLWKVDVY